MLVGLAPQQVAALLGQHLRVWVVAARQASPVLVQRLALDRQVATMEEAVVQGQVAEVERDREVAVVQDRVVEVERAQVVGQVLAAAAAAVLAVLLAPVLLPLLVVLAHQDT